MSVRITAFCGCLILAILGAAYATFNLVAGVVSHRLHFTSSETAIVANSGIVGSWLHITNGAYVVRYGPRATIRVGMALWGIGFGAMTLLFAGLLPPVCTKAWAVACFNFCGMHGASFATMAALAELPPLFDERERPAMMGALGATFALGQALISSFYAVVLRHFDLPVHFGVLCVLGIAVMAHGYSFFPADVGVPSHSVGVAAALTARERQCRDAAYRLIIATSVVLFTGHTLQLYLDGAVIRFVGFAAWLCATVGFLSFHRWIVAPLFAGDGGEGTPANVLSAEHDSPDEAAPTVQAPVEVREGGESPADATAFLFRLEFWMLFLSYFCCAGLASALNSIVSPIVLAVQPEVPQGAALSASPPSALLTTGQLYGLAALCRCWGGLFFGRIAQHRLAGSKVVVCMLCHQFSFVTYVMLFALLSASGLYVVLPLVNFAWGMLYSSSQILAVDLFGYEHFSTLWGALNWILSFAAIAAASVAAELLVRA